MKLWCCLCFTEEEQDTLNLMKEEDISENDVVPGVGAAAVADHHADDNRDDDRFAMTPVQPRAEALVSWTGECSAAACSDSTVAGSVESRDLSHKRAKFYADFEERYFSTNAGKCSASNEYGDYDFINDSLRTNGETFCDTFALMGGGEESGFDSSIVEDGEGDNSDILKVEDVEVRMDLTDDLLHMVFSFLDHPNLCKAARVCKQWRSASAHEDFWKSLNFEDRNISVEQFEDMCRRYPNATAVSISGSAIYLLVMRAISSLRNLEVLTLGRGQIADTFFHALADCSMLKKLNINDSTLGNGIQEITINHDRLCHLQLTKCRVMRIAVRCPQLETMSLKRSNMAQVVLNCPLLHELDIGSCHKLPDAAIRAAATSCPQLVSLDMSNCSCVSDETLREIALSCASLSFLDASYCPNISLESVRLPMLTVLKLHSCEGITSASMAAIAHSDMLEVLELDNCSLLTSVSLDLPRLQTIRLVHCRKFADLNLRTMMLSNILVSNCPALHRINITSNSLQKLALQKQESLTTLALQCQSLQEVDLSECESLTNSICDVFNDVGGCPMLKSLVLANCESLTSVRFFSTSLVSLSLADCRAITTLELTCPNLEKVILDGCDHLERASFCPVGLRSLNLGICPKLNILSIEATAMVSLELKGCGVLSEASVNCPLLTSLDASFCSQLTNECLSATTASCPMIESLILMSCSSIGLDGLCSLQRLPNLTLLDLSYTFLVNLQPVFESCTQLKVLKLQACKYLTDSSLEPLYKRGALPALQELDLSYATLCQSAIEELLSCCTHLTHVNLTGCANMHDLNWGCSRGHIAGVNVLSITSSYENVHELSEQPTRLLQNLNCVGCLNIRKVFIPLTAHCSCLLFLNLSLSTNLKEVDVACLNLSWLNLSNCYSLEVLKLDCTRLTSLFLQSCNIDEEAVETAISKCTMLETLDVRFCPKISSMSMGRLRAACPSLKRIFSSLSAS
ncbi:F-box/LRR-repeat protein 15-like [Vigna umbellata]|uniref:F-box/LRR-repeat protein 15-like n=1 Tax=Vigna umbellata TaxID=87088 RepID=UPI001F5F4FD2|nr:F-box/LRR-repeat protein 15-like [Vigna umbellata]